MKASKEFKAKLLVFWFIETYWR